MNSMLTQASKLWAKIVITTVMAFFVIFSVTIIFMAMFTEVVGYKAYIVDKDGVKQKEPVYTHMYSDGSDKKIDEYEDAGIEIYKENIHSDFTKGQSIAHIIITQFISLVILSAFIYSQLSKLGRKDNTDVNYKGYAEDKFKGLKIGLITVAPFAVFYLLHVVFALGVKPDFSMALYRIVNYIFSPVLNVIIGKEDVLVGDLTAVRFVLIAIPLLVIPLVSWISYVIGYKRIEFLDNFIYKSSKKDR